MCLVWARKYTLCGCIREITTNHCPPEKKSECPGEKITFLQNDLVTCKECWRGGDKRNLTPCSIEDLDSDEYEGNYPDSMPSNTGIINEPDEPALSSSTKNSDPSITNYSDTIISPGISEESDSEEEIWHDAIEYIPESDEEQSDDDHSDIFVDAFDYIQVDEENTSPGPGSRPSTPFLDLKHPEWLDIVDGIEASRVCRPVDRVFPRYRARSGPGQKYLASGEFSGVLKYILE